MLKAAHSDYFGESNDADAEAAIHISPAGDEEVRPMRTVRIALHYARSGCTVSSQVLEFDETQSLAGEPRALICLGDIPDRPFENSKVYVQT